MKIVDVQYAAKLPLYLIIDFCGHQHKIQLDVIEASKLKSFMRRAKEDFEKNQPRPDKTDTIFLGIIPLGESSPIPYAEYLKRQRDKDGS